jgi:biotin carboxylase
MEKKKLMILGAAANQVPIITKAKQMGFFTIAVSVDGNYPGFAISDMPCKIDVREKEKLLEIARQEKICGILTDQTDISVPTVAYVAEKMGLPGIGYDCALRFTNKFKMRQHGERIGILMPEYYQASSLEEAWKYARRIGLPFILKPVDNQGSRGVSKVIHFDEFEEKYFAAKSFSKEGFVIMERFFNGREIVVEGFASDFDFTNLIIGDSYNFDLPDMFIPRRRIFPTALNDGLKNKVLEVNNRLVKGLGLKFGITHSEFLVDENTEEICLMEIAARGGGVFISSDLIPLCCGIDVNELLIRIAAGEKASIDPEAMQERASGYICFYLPEGKILGAHGVEALSNIHGVHKVSLKDISAGAMATRMKDKTQRLGPILLSGMDRQAIQKTIDQVQDTFTVDVETSAGIAGIQW